MVGTEASGGYGPAGEEVRGGTAQVQVHALDQRLEVYKQISAHSQDAIAIIDTDGRYLEQNAAHRTLIGYSDDELRDRTPTVHLGEETMARVLAELEATHHFRGIVSSRTRAGALLNLDLTAFAVLDETGQPACYVGIKRDVTRLSRIEETIRESEERFRWMVDLAPDVMYRLAAGGTLTELSPAFETITGWRAEEWLGLPFTGLVHPEDLPLALDRFEQALQGNILDLFELRIRSSSGAYLIGEFRQAPRIEDGRVTGVVGVARDITARKQAEEERGRLLAQVSNLARRLQKLADASLSINSGGSEREILQIVTDQARDVIGAHQSITRMHYNGDRAEAVSAVSVSEKYASWRGFDASAAGEGTSALVCDTNRPMRLSQEHLEAHPLWQICQAQQATGPPLRGLLASPLISRDGRNLGLIQLSDKYDGEFSEQDEFILVQFAQLASVAVENARLYADAELSRAEAEGAQQRDAFLVQATTLVVSSLDLEATLHSVARLAVGALADWCAIALKDPDDPQGRLRTVMVAHVDPKQEDGLRELYGRYPANAADPRGLGLGKTAQTGEPELLADVTESFLRQSARDDEHFRLMSRTGVTSAMNVPLIARGNVLGAITYAAAESGRRYSQAHLDLALALTARCAIAVDNSRLYEAAAEHRQELRAVLNSIVEGVVSLDRNLRVRETNTYASQFLGVTAEAARGMSGGEVIRLFEDATGSASFSIGRLVRQSMREREPVHVDEAWLEAPAGAARSGGACRVPVAVTVAPRQAAGHSTTGAVVLFRDITRWREVDELRESIISLVSHELRTPLLHIKGFASSLLETDVEWPETTRMDFIRTIDQEADRLTRLVKDLLEMSRMASGQMPLQMDLSTAEGLISGAVREAEPFVKEHQVLASVPADLPAIKVDIRRAEMVLVNLLENAAKYSPPGTEIEVRAYRRRSALAFSVADQGAGVPEDQHEAIFEKFTRLETPGLRQTPGTGLGLALCKAIIESHGGRIWVDNGAAGGATFTFTLPV